MRNAQKKKPGEATVLSCRTALDRLGIGVALGYSAPTIVHLYRSANATLSSTPCGRGKDKTCYCHGRPRRGSYDNGHGKGKVRVLGHRKGHR